MIINYNVGNSLRCQHYSIAKLLVFSAMAGAGLLSYITCEIFDMHDSFIFPLVNKSAGIWLIGIGMNAKTVLHRAFRLSKRWRRITAASCLRSCCTTSALSQNTTRMISGFKYQSHSNIFPFRFAPCILSLIIVRTNPRFFFVWAKYYWQ